MHRDFGFRVHVPVDMLRQTCCERYVLVHDGITYTSKRARPIATHALPMAELVIARGHWLQDPRASRHAALAIR